MAVEQPDDLVDRLQGEAGVALDEAHSATEVAEPARLDDPSTIVVVVPGVGRQQIPQHVIFPAERAQVTARQMQRLPDAGDDRAAVLSRSVGVLSDDDERLLIDLLRHTEDGDR
jgi:hypothetical protein